MTSAFVGRRAQLDDLATGVEAAVRGHGSLWVIRGEAGVGKSRLADEAARAGSERGVGVVRARCREDGAPGFWPWTQLLRAILRRDTELADRIPAPTRRELSVLLPELRTGRDAAEQDVAPDRIELLDAVITALRSSAVSRPLLAIIDDVQWADAGSLGGLRLIADELHDMSMCLVVVERRPDGSVDPVVRAELDAVARAATAVDLAGLSEAEVAELIEASGRHADRAMAGRVRDRTRGNVLYVLELLKGGVEAAAASTGDADSEGSGAAGMDTAVADAGVAIPAGLGRLLDARVDRLDPLARPLLEVAAVAGVEVERGVLVAVLGEVAVADGLKACERDGILERAGRPGDHEVYRFAHPLLRDAFVERVPAGRLAGLHGAIADAQIAAAGGAEDERLPAIAEHLLAAVPARDVSTAVDWARRAAVAATRQLAYELAARLLEDADAVVARQTRAAPGLRLELLLGLGEARLRAGWIADARRAFRAAAALAEALGRPEDLTVAALGLGGGPSGFEVALHDERQVELLRLALAELGDGRPDLRSRLTARLSIALTHLAAPSRRAELSRSAVRLAEDAGDAGAAAYALGTLCDALAAPAHTEERLEATRRMLDLAVEARDPDQELVARRHRIVALAELGRMGELDLEIEAFARLADEPGHSYSRWVVPVLRTMRQLMDGRLEAAEASSERAAALARRAQSIEGEQLVVAQRWAIRREQGRVAEMEAGVREQAEAHPAIAVWRLWLCRTLFETPRVAEARALFRRLADRGFEALPRDSTWLAGATILAELSVGLEATREATALYDELAPHAGLYAIDEWASVNYGSVHRPLALLAAMLGRDDAARGHFGAAIEADSRVGAVLCLARTTADTAAFEARHTHGRGPERPAAPDRGTFARQGEYWTVSLGDETARIRDAKGMRLLAVLLARPGVEVHSLDLERAVAGAPAASTHAVTRREAVEAGLRVDGDRGAPVVDAAAVAAYRDRVRDLGAELATAEAAGDVERATRAEDERTRLLAELAAARGLGGRRRVAGTPGERARLNATRAIRSALDRIEAGAPGIGGHLRRTVRTGLWCVYEPDPRAPVSWSGDGPPAVRRR